MTTRRHVLVWCGGTFAGALLVPAFADAESASEELAVVAGRQSPLEGLTLNQLKRLYLGDAMQGPGGEKLLPLNRDPKSPERIGFDRSVLGMSPDAVARYWIDRKIRGQSGAPRAVEPGPVAERVVARLPGALVYVRAKEVGSEVKVLRIDGKRPGEPGYPVLMSAADRAEVNRRTPSLL
jgi:hypothetical protein